MWSVLCVAACTVLEERTCRPAGMYSVRHSVVADVTVSISPAHRPDKPACASIVVTWLSHHPSLAHTLNAASALSKVHKLLPQTIQQKRHLASVSTHSLNHGDKHHHHSYRTALYGEVFKQLGSITQLVLPVAVSVSEMPVYN